MTLGAALDEMDEIFAVCIADSLAFLRRVGATDSELQHERAVMVADYARQRAAVESWARRGGETLQ